MVEVHDLTIAKLARASGVNRETVRFYEARGLLAAPPRSASGYRLYAPSDARRVRFIRVAQALGFTLEEIGELLSLRGSPNGTCGVVKAKAMEKIAKIDRKIKALTDMKAVLVEVSSECDGGSSPIDECPMLCALDKKADT